MSLRYWLAAMRLPFLSKKMLEVLPEINAIFQATETELSQWGFTPKQIFQLQHINWPDIDKELAWSQQPNHHLISILDTDYPLLLKQISDPPLVLFVKGNKVALQHPQIAVVGSRKPTYIGVRNAEHFTQILCTAGLAITSGMAKGIDGASHKAALAVQGITIAVCGTGLNYCYPLSHRKLQQEIINNNGAVISEFPLNTPAFAGNFPQRNRIIAGLSLGVLVVEAALRSGSLITARHATEQGREVFAIPGVIQNPAAQGCHHLIREGAKLVESAVDILAELKPLLTASMTPNPSALEPEEKKFKQLLAQIEYEITSLDVILLRSGLTVAELSSMLLTLELNGYVQSVPGGYVRVVQT